MLAHYRSIKNSLPPNTLLGFHVGEFIEFFEEDAKIVSDKLNLFLTRRNDTPMSGFPFYSRLLYSKPLIAFGYKVAFAEMLNPFARRA